MLPSLIPTADLRPMLDFARAGSVAGLFFFDESVLNRRRQAALAIEKAELEAEDAAMLAAAASNSNTMLPVSSASGSGFRAGHSLSFGSGGGGSSSGGGGGGSSSASAFSTTRDVKYTGGSPEEPEATSVCNILWPAFNAHDYMSSNTREAKLDDDETELLLMLQDNGPLARQTHKSRSKSILMLRDKNRNNSNSFEENLYAAGRVGGEDGMRLLLSVITPRNRQKFGVFGSVVETATMAQRFSCTSLSGDGEVEAVNRRTFKAIRDRLDWQQRKQNRAARRQQIDFEAARIQNLQKCATAATTKAQLATYDARLDDLETELNQLDEASDGDFEPDDSYSRDPDQQQQPQQSHSHAPLTLGTNISDATKKFSDATASSKTSPSNAHSNTNHATFFSFAAYIEEFRDNAVEAFGAATFLKHSAAIFRRVAAYINACPAHAPHPDGKYKSGESYGVDLDRAVNAVSHEERFHAFSIFFEAGLAYLFLGSAHLGLTHLTRAGTIISAMLRGESPPPLLLRLRVLLCLAVTKFFAGFALQRSSHGIEAAQELRRARHLLFDVDAMCRALLRSVSGKEERTVTQAAIAAIVSRSDDYSTRNMEPGMFTDDHSPAPGASEAGDAAAASTAAAAAAAAAAKQRRSSPSSTPVAAAAAAGSGGSKKDKRRGSVAPTEDDATENSRKGGVAKKQLQQQQKMSLDDVCRIPGGMQALEVVRRVTRSFVRHCMLHEAHALSSTVASPLIFHAATAATSVSGLSRVPDSLRQAVQSARGEEEEGNEQQQQQQQPAAAVSAHRDISPSVASSSGSGGGTHNHQTQQSWPGKTHLDSCLRALKVLDDMTDAMHDVAAAGAGGEENNTNLSSSSFAAPNQNRSISGADGDDAATAVAGVGGGKRKHLSDSNAAVGDIFTLAGTALSLILAVSFSPDVGSNGSLTHISAVGARTFLPRGVLVTTQLIDSCQNALRILYPMQATKNDLDVNSPWLLQRPMLRPGVIVGSLLRYAYLMRAVFHSLRLLWPEAASDLTVLVTMIETAEEPVPRHIYGALKLVNTALMQQRDSVHLVRTTHDVLPPVLPVDEANKLSGENDVLLKLLPVVEVLRQTLIDTTATRATVEVNFFSNGVMAERVAWRSHLETEGGAILAEGCRFEDYGAAGQIRTSHVFETVTVQHILEARRQSKLGAGTSSSSSSSTGGGGGVDGANSKQQQNDHKFLLPPFPFAATLRCDVTGNAIPLQLDISVSDAASVVLFHMCRACGLRVAPEAFADFKLTDQKRVCVSKLCAASLCHLGCEVRHCVSANGAGGTSRLTVADVLRAKDDVEAEKLCGNDMSVRSSSNNHSSSFVQRSLSAQQNQLQLQQQQQKWEADWKVGRLHIWDPISFLRFECQSPSDTVLCDTLAETYRRTANNPYEVLLWNPSCGPRPEAEPIVWVMPPEDSSATGALISAAKTAAEKNQIRHIFASKDTELILRYHLQHGTADVVSANCLEVIRDRAEDASSDHIHRMVRGRATRARASEALKRSCCVVCNKSLLFAETGAGTASALGGGGEDEDESYYGGGGGSRAGDGEESWAGRSSLVSHDDNSSLLRFGEEDGRGEEEEDVQFESFAIDEGGDDNDDDGGDSPGAMLSPSAAFEVFALGEEEGATTSCGDSTRAPPSLSSLIAAGRAGNDDDLHSLLSRGKATASSLSVAGSTLTHRRHKIQKRWNPRGAEVRAITDVAGAGLSKASYLRSTAAGAVFFFRCIICGVVAHKHCAHANQDSATTDAVLREQSRLQTQSLGVSAQTLPLSASPSVLMTADKESLAGSVLSHGGASLTSRISLDVANNVTTSLAPSVAQSQLSKDQQIEKTSISQQQQQQQQLNQPVKHPLRIVNEFFDIDSLCHLRSEHERMETAESAALRSGETLRKWVESDRAGGGDDDDDGGEDVEKQKQKQHRQHHSAGHLAESPSASVGARGGMGMSESSSFGAGGGASAVRAMKRRKSGGAGLGIAGGASFGAMMEAVLEESSADVSESCAPFADSVTSATPPPHHGAATTTSDKKRWQSPYKQEQPREHSARNKMRKYSPLRHHRQEEEKKSRGESPAPRGDDENDDTGDARQQQQEQHQRRRRDDTSPSTRLTFIGDHVLEQQRHQPTSQSRSRYYQEQLQLLRHGAGGQHSRGDPVEELDRELLCKEHHQRPSSTVGQKDPQQQPPQQQQQQQQEKKPERKKEAEQLAKEENAQQKEDEEKKEPTRAELFDTLLASNNSKSKKSGSDEHDDEHANFDSPLFRPEKFVRADRSVDDVSLRILFRENCDPTTQQLSLFALDEICQHVGLTGGQLVEMMARKDGVGKRFADILARGVPVPSGGAKKSPVSPVASADDSSMLRGFTVVDGEGLSFEEFSLAMCTLVAQ